MLCKSRALKLILTAGAMSSLLASENELDFASGFRVTRLRDVASGFRECVLDTTLPKVRGKWRLLLMVANLN